MVLNMGDKLRIIHFHPTFSLGGKEARTVHLMNAFGDAAEHVLVIANRRDLSARDAIGSHVKYEIPSSAPRLRGAPSVKRLAALARYMSGFDLALSYNRGALDSVLAKQLFGGCPLIHHEDGFNADEATRLKSGRNIYRRFALRAADRVVVPSKTLEEIALCVWRQPREKLERIPNSADPSKPGTSSRTEVGASARRASDKSIVCCVANLRPVKNLPRLVRAFAAAATSNAELVIVGEGPERERILTEAGRLGIADRIRLVGFTSQPERYLREANIFALSSDSEQQPIALLEAMSAGLPVVSTDVGDIATMVASENRRFIVDRQNETALASALREMMCNDVLRRELGAANAARSASDYCPDRMVAAYARLYSDVARHPGSLFPSRPVDLAQASMTSPMPAGAMPCSTKKSNISSHQRQKPSRSASVET